MNIGLPPRLDLFLHELIPQIPLFWNYENSFMFIKNLEKHEND